MRILEFVSPEDLNEAYEILCSQPKAMIIGGGVYSRLQKRSIPLAIEISHLGLDYIKEVGDSIVIGSMATLRDIEVNPVLVENNSGVLSKAVSQIAGVPIRNIATIGGSICGKYPFSDLLTPLLVMGAQLKFFEKGIVEIEDYLNNDNFKRDILIEIIIPNKNLKCDFRFFKQTYGDFSLCNVAVSKDAEYKIAIGARPGRAKFAFASMAISNDSEQQTSIDTIVESAIYELEFEDDYRASGDYRRVLAGTLLKEALLEVE